MIIMDQAQYPLAFLYLHGHYIEDFFFSDMLELLVLIASVLIFSQSDHSDAIVLKVLQEWTQFWNMSLGLIF